MSHDGKSLPPDGPENDFVALTKEQLDEIANKTSKSERIEVIDKALEDDQLRRALNYWSALLCIMDTDGITEFLLKGSNYKITHVSISEHTVKNLTSNEIVYHISKEEVLVYITGPWEEVVTCYGKPTLCNIEEGQKWKKAVDSDPHFKRRFLDEA